MSKDYFALTIFRLARAYNADVTNNIFLSGESEKLFRYIWFCKTVGISYSRFVIISQYVANGQVSEENLPDMLFDFLDSSSHLDKGFRFY